MKSKNIFVKILVFIFAVLVIIPIWNYFSDDYGVFGRKYNSLYSYDIFQNDQHFKLNTLTDKRLPKFDSIIFGASQAEAISTLKLGRNWYNVSAMTLTPYEFLDTMNFLKSKNIHIKNVLFLIQPDVVFTDKKTALNDKNKYFMLTGYPFKNSEKFKYYLNYLFLSPSKQNKEIYTMDYFYKIKVLYDGSIVGKDDVLTEKYDHSGTSEMEKPYDLYFQKHVPDEIITEMKAIVEYCKNEGIDLRVFLSPDYVKASESYDLAEYEKFKKQLAEIVPYYDFSGKNEITLDEQNYMNFDHFSARTGDLIIDRIYFQDKNKPPKIKNFGNYIELKKQN